MDEHRDEHKDLQRLESLHMDLEQVRVINRAAHAHEYFTVINSAGEYKRTKVMVRSISEKGLDKLSALHVELTQVTVRLDIGGDLRQSITVSERITMDDLRKTVAHHLQWRCRVQPKEFPAKDRTEVIVVPSLVPCKTLLDVCTPSTVPYLICKEYKSPIEILPDASGESSMEIATSYLDTPATVRPSKRPIRTDDEIQVQRRSRLLSPSTTK
jgi:hypothetical protein